MQRKMLCKTRKMVEVSLNPLLEELERGIDDSREDGVMTAVLRDVRVYVDEDTSAGDWSGTLSNSYSEDQEGVAFI